MINQLTKEKLDFEFLNKRISIYAFKWVFLAVCCLGMLGFTACQKSSKKSGNKKLNTKKKSLSQIKTNLKLQRVNEIKPHSKQSLLPKKKRILKNKIKPKSDIPTFGMSDLPNTKMIISFRNLIHKQKFNYARVYGKDRPKIISLSSRNVPHQIKVFFIDKQFKISKTFTTTHRHAIFDPNGNYVLLSLPIKEGNFIKYGTYHLYSSLNKKQIQITELGIPLPGAKKIALGGVMKKLYTTKNFQRTLIWFYRHSMLILFGPNGKRLGHIFSKSHSWGGITKLAMTHSRKEFIYTYNISNTKEKKSHHYIIRAKMDALQTIWKIEPIISIIKSKIGRKVEINAIAAGENYTAIIFKNSPAKYLPFIKNYLKYTLVVLDKKGKVKWKKEIINAQKIFFSKNEEQIIMQPSNTHFSVHNGHNSSKEKITGTLSSFTCQKNKGKLYLTNNKGQKKALLEDISCPRWFIKESFFSSFESTQNQKDSGLYKISLSKRFQNFLLKTRDKFRQ